MSDPTLLEILSLGSDPPSVVPHFQSGLFDSLSNVTFDKVDKTRMLEMFSQQGEKVCSSPSGMATSYAFVLARSCSYTRCVGLLCQC